MCCLHVLEVFGKELSHGTIHVGCLLYPTMSACRQSAVYLVEGTAALALEFASQHRLQRFTPQTGSPSHPKRAANTALQMSREVAHGSFGLTSVYQETHTELQTFSKVSATPALRSSSTEICRSVSAMPRRTRTLTTNCMRSQKAKMSSCWSSVLTSSAARALAMSSHALAQ